MAKETVAQKRLLGLIKKLSAIRGRHTELITIYVPSGTNLNIVSTQVTQEQGTAANIKSKAVRKNVLGALEKISQHLKLYKQAPANGLALFCGNVSEKEGESDIELWAIEPPEKLNQRLYRCDQEFVLDPLKHMVREKEIYGLIVLDKSDAEIGLLVGKRIDKLKHLESLVPGKTKKGGWCVHEDTMIPLSDGRVRRMKDLGDERFMCYDFKNMRVSEGRHNHFFSRRSDEALKIRTIAPTLEVVVTPEHKFFVATEAGFGTRDAGDIRPNDRLLAARRIDVKGKNIKIGFKPPVRHTITRNGLNYILKRRKELGLLQKSVAKRIGISQTMVSKVELGERSLEMKNLEKLLAIYHVPKAEFLRNFTKRKADLSFPSHMNEDFAQLLGYLAGDGNKDKNRITISEAEPDILENYKKTIKGLFSIEPSIKERTSKGYSEMRIYSKSLLSLIETEFPGILTPHDKDVPDNICGLPKEIISGFVRGIFDAEGWVDKKAKVLGLTVNSHPLISKLQMILLRWGIVSSLIMIGTRGSFAKKMRYMLRITDISSLKAFCDHISFSSYRKNAELKQIIIKSETSYVDQIPINGRHLLSLIHKLGMTTDDFQKVQDFFFERKGMSYHVFRRNILEIIRKRHPDGAGAEVIKYLESILNSDIISLRVKSVEKAETGKLFYDMDVPKYRSFIANGLVLHNSQARFARVREGLLNDHLKKTGEIATSYFREQKDLRGIVIGGPGPIKDMFVNGDFLPTDVKSRVLGVVDTSYTGEYGLEEMVARGEDILAEASVTRERKLLERFFSELAKESGLAVYGIMETVEALEKGAVETLLLSEDFDWVHAALECPSCKKKIEKMVKRDKKHDVKCPSCQSAMEPVEETDASEKLDALAERVGTKVEIISTDSREGEQLHEMGGIAGILRYNV